MKYANLFKRNVWLFKQKVISPYDRHHPASNRYTVANKHTVLAMLLGLLLSQSLLAVSPDLTLYSSRDDRLLQPLIDHFADETDISVRIVTGKTDEVMQRLKREGEDSPADLILLVGAERLEEAKHEGLLRQVKLNVINELVPSYLRDLEYYWFGLSQQARVIVYSKERVDPKSLSTYEALAKPQWKGRLCIPSASLIYNKSLVASLVAHEGMSVARFWLNNFVANFANIPSGDDLEQIRSIAKGLCDVAVANTYYYGKMISGNSMTDSELVNSVGIFWPNQEDRGVYINISGIGFTHAINKRTNETKAHAVRFVEYLLSKEVQSQYAAAHFEYPVRSDVEPSELLQSWGQFTPDNLNLLELTEHADIAASLMKRAKWQ